MEILPDGSHGAAMTVPLEHPFSNFITATWRGGSAPSNLLDVLGTTNDRPGMCYARINLLNPIQADFEATVEKTPLGSRLRCDGTRSISGSGKVVAWDWDIGGEPAQGATVTHEFAHGGFHVALVDIMLFDDIEAEPAELLRHRPGIADSVVESRDMLIGIVADHQGDSVLGTCHSQVPHSSPWLGRIGHVQRQEQCHCSDCAEGADEDENVVLHGRLLKLLPDAIRDAAC